MIVHCFLLSTVFFVNGYQMVIPPHWLSSIPRNSRRSMRSSMRLNELRLSPLMNLVAMIISAQQPGPEFKMLQQCCKLSVTWYCVFFFFHLNLSLKSISSRVSILTLALRPSSALSAILQLITWILHGSLHLKHS